MIALWYVIGTLFIPALLLPLAASYYPRIAVSSTRTFWAMLTGFLVALAAMIAGQLQAVDGAVRYPFGIEPMYGGLTATVLMYVLGWMKKETHPGGRVS